jgi:hypothetical protein
LESGNGDSGRFRLLLLRFLDGKIVGERATPLLHGRSLESGSVSCARLRLLLLRFLDGKIYAAPRRVDRWRARSMAAITSWALNGLVR